MFSQNNEEQIIADYFGDRFGAYLSIGENDGITFSNVYALYKKGWGGVNVEPSSAYSKLIQNQPDRINIKAALGTKRGRMILHESGAHCGDNVGLLSTLKPEEMNRWPQETFTPVEVEVIVVADLPRINYNMLSLDVEGMELEVLPGIIDAHPEIELAVIEWNGKHRKEFDEIMKGYKVIAQNPENLIYAKIKHD